MMKITEKLAQHIESKITRNWQAPITTLVTPQEIRKHLAARYDFSHALSLDKVFDDVTEMLWQWAEHATNPRHFGLFRPTVELASIIADALVALYDPNLATWDFSPAANEIERHVLQTLARRFGPELAEGSAHFTSGGQEANHTAVAVALTWKFPKVGGAGLRSLKGQPVFYLSQEGHHSFDKIAHSTGLGRQALRMIPVRTDLQMDLAALGQQIKTDLANGALPFMVVGTAGTTSAGVIDPLPELADFAAAHGLWYHVDAAWGGAVALSDNLRSVLAGIERADSITCDAHKWLSVPAGAGMFFSRHSAAVSRTFATQTAYVPDQVSDGRVYPFINTMQWSRRFIGLKLFMMFAEHGLETIARRIERQTELGDYLRERLRDAGWQILNDTPLPVVCFSHQRIAAQAVAPEEIVHKLKHEQTAWISKTLLREQIPALRACIINFQTQPEDVDCLVDGLNRAI
jgi:glutamate/tyrosine decarboxylase-like PLP-dependent enzyme